MLGKFELSNRAKPQSRGLVIAQDPGLFGM